MQLKWSRLKSVRLSYFIMRLIKIIAKYEKLANAVWVEALRG